MIAVKGSVPREGPSRLPIIYRAEPFYAKTKAEARWHIEQKWRHDNLQPHPSAFAKDLGLAHVKVLHAAVETFLWNPSELLPASIQAYMSSLTGHLSTSLTKFVAPPGSTHSTERLPSGAIERCNHWVEVEDLPGQHLCGFWGWRGRLVAPTTRDFTCEDTLSFGCDVYVAYPRELIPCNDLVYDAHFWRSNTALWGSRSQVPPDGWYVDDKYEPLEGSGQLTPYLSAYQELMAYAPALVSQSQSIVHGDTGVELRLAMARVANGLAARAVEEAPAEDHMPCTAEKQNLLQGQPYSPWCKQARMERAFRALEYEVARLDDKLKASLPLIEFDGGMQLRCWRVASTQANDFFIPSEKINGPPDAEETISGINFEWSIVKKQTKRSATDYPLWPSSDDLLLFDWTEVSCLSRGRCLSRGLSAQRDDPLT